MITTKMNVIDSTESTDTMTFINNEHYCQLSLCILLNLSCVTNCINSDTKTLDYMEINCSVLNSFSSIESSSILVNTKYLHLRRSN